jgi:hypothetical protein
VPLEQPLDDAGHVGPGPGGHAPVEFGLRHRGQVGIAAGDDAGPLVEGQHGLQVVLEPAAAAALAGELEGDGVNVLRGGADDPLAGQCPAGTRKRVAGGQLTGECRVEAGGGQGGRQVGVADGGAGAGPGDDLAEQPLRGSFC